MTDPDRQRILGLWASASGPVLWVRPHRGRSVLVSMSSGATEPAIDLGPPGREQPTLIGTWDSYDYELCVPLPALPHGAELLLDLDNYSWVDEGGEPEDRLSGGVSMDDVPGALRVKFPSWLLPLEPYRRVSEAKWPEYAILSAVPRWRRSPAMSRAGSSGRRTTR